jgi:hypothetical protein
MVTISVTFAGMNHAHLMSKSLWPGTSQVNAGA